MVCSTRLREEGKSYPRTCPDHGLFTPCPPPPGVAEEFIIDGGYFTIGELRRELAKFDQNARVKISKFSSGVDVDIKTVEQDDVDPNVINVCG